MNAKLKLPLAACPVKALAFLSLAWAYTPASAEQLCHDIGQVAVAANRFADQGDGTVTDTATGLRWKRCSEGQTWSSGTCIGEAATFNWHQALEHAERVSFAGSDEWRVPTLVELTSIVEPACTDPAINLSVFPATPSFAYWSSTPFEYFIRLAWAVYFTSGRDGYSPKDYGFFNIRLVRDADRDGR